MKDVYKKRLTIAIVVLSLSVIALLGLYPVSFLNFQFSALLQKNIVNFSIFSAIILCLIILSTLIFGRFYCSTLCPFGTLQEIINLIYNKIRKNKLPEIEYIKPSPYKYFIMALSFGFLVGGSALIMRYVDPYTIFGSYITLTTYGIIFTSVILVLVFYKNGFFCSSICPVGALLGLLAKFAPFKIHIAGDCVKCGMCARYCPTRCINKEEGLIDNENCINCLKCTLVCPEKGIIYGLKKEKPVFDINKRNSLISFGASALFIGAILAGVKFSRTIYSKLKDIILPAGADEIQRMANKCLNCNLCINNCPTGILQKADKDIPFVHIDYSKGKHYCAYNCKKCSESCPSGAIKKISLKEKQNTRIAIAVISKDNCVTCKNCVNKCPTGAISIVDSSAVVDASKCIGCGGCKAVCPMNAVEIYPINKQAEI